MAAADGEHHGIKARDVKRGMVVRNPHGGSRGPEVRGTAAVLPEGGKAMNERFEDMIVRIRPARIISLGIDSGELAANARSVSTT